MALIVMAQSRYERSTAARTRKRPWLMWNAHAKIPTQMPTTRAVNTDAVKNTVSARIGLS